MDRVTSRLTLALAILLVLGAGTLVPRGIDAARLIAAAEDPEKLAELGLDRRFRADVAVREIEAALAARDPELAQSFLALADERSLPVDPRLRERVQAATDTMAASLRVAGRFINGFVVGEPSDLAGLAGTVTGDLFVYGDIRDVVRETAHLVRGEEADELILGLACVGLAVTAGTYASFGAGAPARVGVSLVKAAGKTGRMTAKLTAAIIRPLRAAIDTTALKSAFRPRALLQPVTAVRSARAAVKMEKAQGLVRVFGDAGRIHAKAGTRAALDSLRLAESPKDVARLARLADAKGGKTRAVLKLLGRGAIMLTVGLFELAAWMFWALINLIWLVVALKRFVERTTLSAIRRRKICRAQRLAAAALPG
ncbi:MAG TPA: hypothetical protein VHG27_01785 [Xanthobacteraceae bacterium]|nr:hypothetical protein [Xanthobacteraceae bacterium]